MTHVMGVAILTSCVACVRKRSRRVCVCVLISVRVAVCKGSRYTPMIKCPT